MVVNFEGAVVNLRDKIQAADKKKTQTDSQDVKEKASLNGAKAENEKAFIADVIGIRNENKLAATSNTSIQSKEEALDMLAELKQQMMQDSGKAIDAHKKASANAVMQYYPFE